MPAPQVSHEAVRFRPDRFVPAIHRVETPNYSARGQELSRDWSNRLAQSAFLTIKYGLINVEQELAKITGLDHDWDSYGAEPPSTEAILVSRQILHELAGALILPTTVVASAGGGVSIYFIRGNRTAYVESYNDGAQALVMYDQDGATEVLEIGTDIRNSEVGNRISRFLD